MKRWVGLLLVFCLFLTGIPMEVQAASPVSGSCVEVDWYLDGDGTLYITGNGRMLRHGGWDNNAVRKVVIGEGVTSICRGAFQNARNLTTVIFSGTVRTIGHYSFDGCSALSQVWLPDSVVVVGEYAFRNCVSLKDVRMGDRVLMIGKYAFANCPITVLDLPDNLQMLGSFAFAGCLMETVYLPDTVTRLSEGTFKDCARLKNLYIPEGVLSGYRIFENCVSLETVVIPAGLNYYGLFPGCSEIENFVFMGDYHSSPYNQFDTYWANFWYPADNTTWKDAPWENANSYSSWIPCTVSGNTANAWVLTQAQVKQRLEEMKKKYPEGTEVVLEKSQSSENKNFLEEVRGDLFREMRDDQEHPMCYENLRVGDMILLKSGGYDSFIYERYVITEIYDDYILVGGYEELIEYETAYVTWSKKITRKELESDIYDSVGSRRYYRYCTMYSEAQSLTLPQITEPVVDESRFPQELKSYSAPPGVRASAFNSNGGYANPFTDVPTDRFESAILWAYYNSITTGTTATTFSPEATCTRKQIVTFLWRASGCPEPARRQNPFTDVPSDRFEKAILWAYYAGITTGTTANTFSPNDPCTRKQIVTFLWRATGWEDPYSMENPFTDVPSDRFEKAILWAYHGGITTGTTTTTFSPEAPCTRKQIVTFLWRFMGMPDYSSVRKPAESETVLAAYSPDSVIETLHLTVGRSVQIQHRNHGVGDTGNVLLSSSVEGILTLGENGVVTAANPGETVLSVSYKGESFNSNVDTIKIVVHPRATGGESSKLMVTGTGYLCDGMTAYMGDQFTATFMVLCEGETNRLNVYNSDPSVMHVRSEEVSYDSRTYLHISFLKPGDVTLTVEAEDGSASLSYNIHVEEYYAADPGRDELLAPEEFACYATLVATNRGCTNQDYDTGWKEGAPLPASELTYERAIGYGRATDNAWENSSYWSDGSYTIYRINYVGDQEWNGENCFRFQTAY